MHLLLRLVLAFPFLPVSLDDYPILAHLATCANTGGVLWRLEYRHMGSPGAICLISGVNDPGAVFALSGKVGRSPRVFAARDRDGILRQMQAAALKRMGITLAGRQQPSHSPA